METRYYNLPTILNYTLNSNGPMSMLGGCEGLGWIKSKYAPTVDDDWPDLGITFLSGTAASESGGILRHNFGFTDEIWDSYFKPLVNTDMLQFHLWLLRPLSRGTIRLSSSDPYAPPLIDPNYFSETADMDTIIESLKFALALVKTTAFKKLGTKFYDKIFPGCEGFTPWTDDYWRCFVRYTSSTGYHPSGSCKMGPSTDTKAVVDHQLKVHGIKGLRVADCSIMPVVVSGNTNAPAVRLLVVFLPLKCLFIFYLYFPYFRL